MQQNQTDLLTESVLQINTQKRKKLIPWWIRIFIWIFLFFGAVAPLGLIFGILGYKFQLSIYGLQTNEPISLIGMSIIVIFLFKGITSYSLLKQKVWAVTLGIIDAIIGIFICSFIMIYPFINSDSGLNSTFSIELLLLIPYLLKMIKIKTDWEQAIEI